MKKAIAFILLFCMIFACVSCDNDINSSSESSKETEVKESESESVTAERESQSESESEESSASESESESASESAVETENGSENGSESESESESSSLESETEVIKITEFGQFSSAISKTKESADRLRQMSISASVYNKGSSYSDSEISSALSSAKAIGTFGAIKYPNAGSFMKHFLENTGENYEIDMNVFLKDENALSTRNDEINKALRACEALGVEGDSISIYQIEETVHHNLTGDWKYSVGSYFTSIEIKNLSVRGNVYTATIIYRVTDFYNWDANNDAAVFSGSLGSLTNNLSPKDLHQLHRVGKAREFLSEGEISYTVSWTKGSTVDMIYALND